MMEKPDIKKIHSVSRNIDRLFHTIQDGNELYEAGIICRKWIAVRYHLNRELQENRKFFNHCLDNWPKLTRCLVEANNHIRYGSSDRYEGGMWYNDRTNRYGSWKSAVIASRYAAGKIESIFDADVPF